MNLKHQQALDATTVLVDQLRIDATTQLAALVDLDTLLTDLLDTRQSIGTAALTAEATYRANREARLDRAAARGHTSHHHTVGHTWLNTPAALGTGVVAAPVTMPAVSISAEILHTLQHHVRTLGAGVTLLQQALRRHPTTHPAAYLPTITTDATTPVLVTQLVGLVGYTTSRRRLEALIRDLDHLERTATNVIDGPARTPHPAPCPWCGRPSLVVYHRTPGRAAAYIRCEGTHDCRCDYEHCHCHHPAYRHRHEWTNSGSATHDWAALANLLTTAQETRMLETRAIDAIDRVLALHAETPLMPPADTDCHADNHVLVADGSEIWCTTCDPIRVICGHCLDTTGTNLTWPCPTVTAINDGDPA